MTTPSPPPIERKQHGRRRDPSPIFILTCARSGSTLLRYVLDAHPDVVCPPELNLSQLCIEAKRVWVDMVDDQATQQVRSDLAVKEARRAVEAVMDWWIDRSDKRRFCDKSLSTVDHADVVVRVFPKAHFLLLVRHPLDVVVSGLEACRWGFNAFGFAPYIQMSPQNHVAALIEYWCDNMEKLLNFETRHGDRCYRLYYELLVREPEGTLQDVFRFLGLTWDADIIKRSLDVERDKGPADYEIGYMAAISPRSIGCGSTVPAKLISPAQRSRMNNLLSRLGYPAVSDEWNQMASPLLTEEGPGPADKEVAAIFEERVSPRVEELARTLPDMWKISLRIIVEMSPIRETWVVDLVRGTVERGEGATTGEVIVTRALLIEMAQGDWSPGEALHRGELRVSMYSGGWPERKVVTLLRKVVGGEGRRSRKTVILTVEKRWLGR